MSSLAFFSLTILCLTTVKSSNTARVDFLATNSGIQGHIGMLNGFVWMDLDFSAVDWTDLPENCSVGGLKYHIHEKWTYNENLNSGGTDYKGATACGPTYSGGHFDPWFACGPSSGAVDCFDNGGCIPSSTIWNDINENLDYDYICAPDNYTHVAYTCEVGDWSGKYGLMIIDETTNKVVITGDDTYGSYWEPSMELLYGDTTYKGDAFRSVVIHCNNGDRAFCAPILRGNSNEQTVDISDDQIIETFFEDAGTEFEDMYIKWKNSAGIPEIEYLIPSVLKCSAWDLYLYNAWPRDDYEGEYSAYDCDLSNLGGIYDPTHTCIDNSASIYCTNGTRCKGSSDTQVTYSCKLNEEYYGCAVGDIAGRIGSITGNVGGTVRTIEDPLSPPLFTLGNKAIVFVCSNPNNTGNATGTFEVENVCALTVQTNGTVVFGTPAPTPQPTDQVNMLNTRLGFVVSCLIWMNVI